MPSCDASWQRLLAVSLTAFVVGMSAACGDAVASDPSERPSTMDTQSEPSAAAPSLEVNPSTAVRSNGSNGTRLASLEGIFRLDAGSGCLWVENTVPSLVRTAFVLSGSTYSVDYARPAGRILNNGSPVAIEGDHVTLAGGLGHAGVPGCPTTGDVFLAVVVPQS